MTSLISNPIKVEPSYHTRVAVATLTKLLSGVVQPHWQAHFCILYCVAIGTPTTDTIAFGVEKVHTGRVCS